jgi:hypothetical protein
MQSEETIRKIIAEILFNVQIEEPPLIWQVKVDKASREVYIHVLKPLKMINNALMEEQSKCMRQRK